MKDVASQVKRAMSNGDGTRRPAAYRTENDSEQGGHLLPAIACWEMAWKPSLQNSRMPWKASLDAMQSHRRTQFGGSGSI